MHFLTSGNALQQCVFRCHLHETFWWRVEAEGAVERLEVGGGGVAPEHRRQGAQRGRPWGPETLPTQGRDAPSPRSWCV